MTRTATTLARAALALAGTILPMGCLEPDSASPAAYSTTSEELNIAGNQVFVPFARAPGMPRVVELPLGLKARDLNLPAGEQLDPSLAELGNLLFFDRRLSSNGAVSCATCHVPGNGYSATDFSRGVDGTKQARTTPTALNRAFGRNEQNWIGGQPTLEAQSTAPILNPHEHGLSAAQLVAAVARVPGYVERYRRLAAAGVLPSAAITVASVQRALATFQRATLMSGRSRVDRYEAGDATALTATERRGRLLFHTKARCVLCHSGSNYSDEAFHHIVPVPNADLGRQAVTGLASDFGKFKTPSLRNAARRKPYFHNGDPLATSGMALTLDTVVRRYNNGPPLNERNEDPAIIRLGMSTSDVAAVAAFVAALNGDLPLDPWLSSPGTATSSPQREDVRLSPAVFRAADYRAFNADLAAMTDAQLRAHWLAHGINEGRTAVATFSLKEYRTLHAEVFDATPIIDPATTYRYVLDHYLSSGRARGLAGRHAVAAPFFDPSAYRLLNGAAKALLSYDETFDDYLRHGIAARATASRLPVGFFSVGGTYYYAAARSYCRFPNVAAVTALRRTVGIPSLPYPPVGQVAGGLCVAGSNPPAPTTAPPPWPTTTIVPMDCRTAGSNTPCTRTYACPAGSTIRAVRAACNLEFGLTNLDNVRWNDLRVRRPSDIIEQGHCRVDQLDLQFGFSNILPRGASTTVTIGCSEHDQNGGDCHIIGELLCQ
ncbi:MAG: cytochrome c peroxidase [Kofleriaceae bacterium]